MKLNENQKGRLDGNLDLYVDDALVNYDLAIPICYGIDNTKSEGFRLQDF